MEATAGKREKKWDGKLKQLIGEAPQDFVSWLVEGARFVGELSPCLEGRGIEADTLQQIIRGVRDGLLHIEFQRAGQVEMAERLWEYNSYATRKYKKPVLSVVIYLMPGGPIAKSPYEVKWLDDEEPIHHFTFKVILLWELSTSDILKSGLKGLFPLLPLTREGKRREVVEEIIEKLNPAGEAPQAELLALTQGLASLVFTEPADQDWLIRRFAMLKDILEESWAYQELKQEAQEKGLKEGLQKGLQEGRQEGRQEGQTQEAKQALMIIVQVRFPELASLAQEHIQSLQDLTHIRDLIQKTAVARDANEIQAILLQVPETE